MQFIDGEDLKSLIRRIGRLPVTKVLQLAHQPCSGLGAAHDTGVIHRDLKPANVMIDGWGHARITDFGFARPASDDAPSERVVGTPAYIAPEQYFHNETGVSSDIYSLGPVFYEMLTGERAHSGTTRESLEQSLAGRSPDFTASAHHGDREFVALLDVILWCLQKDPGDRPANALAISASLPGGDPLAAALAAGDTPSAGTVAAARDSHLPSSTFAWSLFAGCLVGLVAAVSLWVDLSHKIGFHEAPQTLASQARKVIEAAGANESLESEAWGFSVDREYLDLSCR